MEVLSECCKWLESTGKYSEHWQSKNMHRQFMLQYTEESEFYVILREKNPVATMVLQDNQRNQSWACVDGKEDIKALYVHWLCVHPEYRGIGLPKILIDFAEKKSVEIGRRILRLDADAKIPQLMKIYRDLGFDLVHIEEEKESKIAFFQKKL
jgi:ribosomal protein S18 acetylase RimI-like enzyme